MCQVYIGPRLCYYNINKLLCVFQHSGVQTKFIIQTERIYKYIIILLLYGIVCCVYALDRIFDIIYYGFLDILAF